MTQVAWTAFEQRREAQLIRDKLRDHFAQLPLPSTLWTVFRSVRTFLDAAMF
jgi:hypothetical protein